MGRLIMTSDDLKRAAELLRFLGAAKRARLAGDAFLVSANLETVDSLEAYGLAAILEAEAAIHSVGASRRSQRPSDRRATRTPW